VQTRGGPYSKTREWLTRDTERGKHKRVRPASPDLVYSVEGSDGRKMHDALFVEGNLKMSGIRGKRKPAATNEIEKAGAWWVRGTPAGKEP